MHWTKDAKYGATREEEEKVHGCSEGQLTYCGVVAYIGLITSAMGSCVFAAYTSRKCVKNMENMHCMLGSCNVWQWHWHCGSRLFLCGHCVVLWAFLLLAAPAKLTPLFINAAISTRDYRLSDRRQADQVSSLALDSHQLWKHFHLKYNDRLYKRSAKVLNCKSVLFSLEMITHRGCICNV